MTCERCGAKLNPKRAKVYPEERAGRRRVPAIAYGPDCWAAIHGLLTRHERRARRSKGGAHGE